MTTFYSSAFFILLCLASCKSATKAYQKGNYTDAVAIAVKNFQKSPDDGETKALLQNAYRYAVNRHQEQIRLLSGSRSDDRWEGLVHQYSALQHLYETVRQNPAAAATVSATDYSDYITTYSEKAAAIYVQRGRDRMAEGSKRAYRLAYAEFDKALRYQTNDAIRRLRDEAYEGAVTKVLVLPVPDNDYRFSSYANPMNRFQQDVIHFLNSGRSKNDFVQFYAAWDGHAGAEPDEVLELNLRRVTIGQPYDDRTIKDVAKEVVIKETVYKPDSIVKQYGKVTARLITIKRTLVSEAQLSITSRSAGGTYLWNDQLAAEHCWQTRFTTFQGDERALSDDDKAALNQREDRAPDRHEIMHELVSRLRNDLCYRVQNHYSRMVD